MLNIKNKETYELAQELSKVTGKSMTFAVTEALREKLTIEKTRSYKKKHSIADELLKIASKILKINETTTNQPTQSNHEQTNGGENDSR